MSNHLHDKYLVNVEESTPATACNDSFLDETRDDLAAQTKQEEEAPCLNRTKTAFAISLWEGCRIFASLTLICVILGKFHVVSLFVIEAYYCCEVPYYHLTDQAYWQYAATPK